MLLDTIHGTIARRRLLNYRIDPEVLQCVLPRPFRPKLYAGYGVGGICMIRFAHLRPRYVPQFMGLDSENAAHRIAVEWEQDGEMREGVFIPRRDTNSWFNRTLGGRVFPGLFSASRFDSRETPTELSLRVVGSDEQTVIAFRGRSVPHHSPSSIFPSLEAAAGFFSLGATGYSATRTPGHYHGMELHATDWTISPLAIDEVRSDFFENESHFPADTAQVDCALLMRDIEHEWHSRPDLYATNGSTLTTKKG